MTGEDDTWNEDCLKERKKILNGVFAHYCYDWDGLPVDETTPEIESCHCGFDEALGEKKYVPPTGEDQEGVLEAPSI